MRACQLCTDLPLGPRPIFQLDQRVRILIVGQAPGRITHAKGRPFDDPSGERLRDWLGIDRETFYGDPRLGIFPMGLCFPGSARNGDKPPPPICAETWRTKALSHLRDVQLTLVLGAYAINWHLPQLKGLSVTEAVRRAPNLRDDLYVMPHPSPRNNRWLKQNPWFSDQILPALRQSVRAIMAPG